MSDETLDVAACLVRIRQGDDDAASALIKHLYPLVMKIVRSHLPRRTAEEDLAQTVFMKIFAKMDQYSGEAPFEHWVSRVAVNTCLSQLNSEKIRPEIRWADMSEEEETVLQSLAATTDDVDAAHTVAAREIVEKLLSHLAPADRLVVSLLHMEGRSIEEVKAVTGWGESLVKIRAFRARRKMQKHLKFLLREKIL